MAHIAWDVDASDGGHTLASPRPTPADRFWEFTTDYVPVGPAANALGDGSLHRWTFREDYVARFTIRHLAPSSQADMLALKKWLMGGGPVDVYTDDVSAASYAGFTLRPGTEPEIEHENETRQHWRFSVELRSDEPILMNYSS